jgi:O-antigen/teichoic acid export membrane protein
MARTAPSRLPGWLVGSGVIAVAMAVMNVGTYGFTILAARLLGPVHYGELAAMMGLLLVLSVLSLGLQATAARRVSATPELSVEIEHEILSVSYRSALVLAVICLAASPVVSAVLHTDVVTAAMLAVTVVPLTVMGGQAGVLQGERRWTPLALIYLMTGVGRVACGVLALLWRPDAFGAMVGIAVGAFLPTVVGWFALRHPTRLADQPTPTTAPDAPATTGHLLHEVAHNSHALLAFFALSNTDVVVARITLPVHQAGLYAGGLILTKAVLFLPQFVVVVAFPSMASRAGRRDMQIKGLGLVLAIGLCAIAAAATLSSLAVIFIGGPQYDDLQSSLWGFAALGTLLAMIQLMVYGVVASQHQKAVYLIWAALLVVLGSVPFVATVTQLLLVVAAVDVALLLALLAVSLRPAPPPSSAHATEATGLLQ